MWVVFFIGVGLGGWAGLWFGGRRALLRLGEYEYKERRRRARI